MICWLWNCHSGGTAQWNDMQQLGSFSGMFRLYWVRCRHLNGKWLLECYLIKLILVSFMERARGNVLIPARFHWRCVSQWQNCSCGSESALYFDTHAKNLSSLLPITGLRNIYTNIKVHSKEQLSETEVILVYVFLPLMFWNEWLYSTPTRGFTSKGWY